MSFEIEALPIILPEEPSDPTLSVVTAAKFPSFWFGTDVYAGGSMFQSIVCSFSPTDAEQIILKSVILDCPLLKTATWVGEWAAGSAIPVVLLVPELSGVLCDYMKGDYLKVGAWLSGKYLTRLNTMQEMEVLAVIASGEVTANLLPDDTTILEDTDVSIYLYPQGQTPVLEFADTVTLFRIRPDNRAAISFLRYNVPTPGQTSLLSIAAGSDILQIDLGGDGSIDSQIIPDITEHGFSPGDIDLDNDVDLTDALLALQFSAGMEASDLSSSIVLPWIVDVNDNNRLGLEDVIYIIRQLAELR